MRKIIVGAQTSIDGVMQGPGSPVEDPTQGFNLGGWAMPYFGQPDGPDAEIERLFSEPFDLLLGRKTYEIFAAFWPFYDQAGDDGAIAKAFQDIKKYVVSGSGDVETSWQNSVLLRDIAAVKRLAQEDGPNLLTQGSTELVHALLAADIVDEISIIAMPVILGRGKKLFADGSAPHAYKLINARATSNGVVIAHYKRGGEVPTADVALPTPSQAEIARQARMKREG